MRIYDITHPIRSGMPVYPGDPVVEVQPWLHLTRGDPVNVARLALGSHTGTHVDAPRHVSGDGPGVDRLALDVLVGPALVAEIGAVPRIGAAALRAVAGIRPGRCRRLLLRTARESVAPVPAHPTLTEGAARVLLDAGVRLLGVEASSVDAAPATGLPVHHLLLGAGVIIVESLDLSAVPPGGYELVCLPLPIRDGDGAPARAVLIAPDGRRRSPRGAR
jgi:arylformamidase